MVKVSELRGQTKEALLAKLAELRAELASLRVAQATGAAASKVAKMRHVRHSIARVLTVYGEQQRAQVRAQFSGKAAKKMPFDLRATRHWTKAQRNALTTVQKNKVTKAVSIRMRNNPRRKFALKA